MCQVCIHKLFVPLHQTLLSPMIEEPLIDDFQHDSYLLLHYLQLQHKYVCISRLYELFFFIVSLVRIWRANTNNSCPPKYRHTLTIYAIHIHYIYLCLLSNNQKSSKQWYVAKSGRGLSLSYVFGNGPTQVVSYLGNQHEVVGSNPFLHITSKCFSC